MEQVTIETKITIRNVNEKRLNRKIAWLLSKNCLSNCKISDKTGGADAPPSSPPPASYAWLTALKVATVTYIHIAHLYSKSSTSKK